jgi:hypothetical protein
MDLILSIPFIDEDYFRRDYYVGTLEKFALEFHPIFFKDEPYNKPIEYNANNHSYSLNAKINSIIDLDNIYYDDRPSDEDRIDYKSWGIDFGINAFNEGKIPESFKVGQELFGEFRLSPRHNWWGGKHGYGYRYSNCVYTPLDFPVIYSWEILRIQMDTTPLIETTESTLVRDLTRISCQDIIGTNVQKDMDGRAEYLLHCRKL